MPSDEPWAALQKSQSPQRPDATCLGSRNPQSCPRKSAMQANNTCLLSTKKASGDEQVEEGRDPGCHQGRVSTIHQASENLDEAMWWKESTQKR